MKIAVGSGQRFYGDDWIHIDGNRTFNHITHHDVINLPCEDYSADVIYASHLLSYFDRIEANYVLNRWWTKLRSGGILRLAVPDFKEMAALYSVGGCELNDILGPLYGKWDLIGTPIYHKTTWDQQSLSKVLRDIGFKEVYKYDWRMTEHSGIDDHSQSYLPKMDKDHGTLISLNIEAVK